MPKTNSTKTMIRTEAEETYKVKKYLWGLIEVKEIIKIDEFGSDIHIFTDRDIKNVFINNKKIYAKN